MGGGGTGPDFWVWLMREAWARTWPFLVLLIIALAIWYCRGPG